MGKATRRMADFEDEYGIVEPLRAKKAKTSKKSQKEARHVEEASDSEEDAGHSMIQRFILLAKRNSTKTQTSLDEFNHLVEGRRTELTDVLDTKALSIIAKDTKLRETTISLVSESLHFHGHENTNHIEPATMATPETLPVYQRAVSLLRSSKDLLEDYQKIHERIEALTTVGRAIGTWDDERAGLERLLDKQAQRVKHDINVQIQPGSTNSRNLSRDKDIPDEDELWTQLAKSTSRDSGIEALPERDATWESVAKHIRRGVQRAVKRLPETEI